MSKEKNVKSRPRPLSPHLQIYKPQMTSMSSIFHRASIVGMFFISLLFVYYIFKESFGFNCQCYNWLTTDETGIIFYKLGLSVSALVFSYWVCASIRHLFFDIGKGLDIPTAYKSGWLSIISTLALTAYIINFGIL